MRFDKRTPPWGVVAVAAFFGVLIWAMSPAITGRAEPWDAAAPYYLVALLIAGFLSGLLTGKPLWLHYAGVIAGQFLYGLVFLAIGPLILLGVSFLAVYGLLFLAGAIAGQRARSAMASQDRRLQGYLSVVGGAPGPVFLDAYGGQSTDELLDLQETHRIDSLVLAFEEAIARKRATQDITPEERNVLAIEALEREMSNGGYGQFFRNTSSEFTSVVVAALRAIDCPKAAINSQDAIDSLHIEGPLTPSNVEHAMNDPSVRQRLAECDVLYRSNDESITPQLFRWIEEHSTKIRIGA